MKDLFYKIIKEASTSTITIDDEKWNNEFFILLEEYINKELELNKKNISFSNPNEEIQIKSLIISYLLKNATPIEFADPIKYLKRRISFLEDQTFDEKRYVALKNTFHKTSNSIYLKIENTKQDIKMETPYRLDFTLIDLDDNELCFKLPSISYGISEENNEKVCYIYSIQNQEEENNEKTIEKNKKISRMLYQINNSNIVEDEKNISVSEVLSVSVLITMLKRKNISNVKVILPQPETNKILEAIRRVASQFEGIIIKDSASENGYKDIELIDTKYKTDNPMLKSVTNNILGRK